MKLEKCEFKFYQQLVTAQSYYFVAKFDNFLLQGPKAFQRHFSEWRHAHGMRCLGIPNTAHFANVTQIEDAMALWEKLKIQKFDEAWKPDQARPLLLKN